MAVRPTQGGNLGTWGTDLNAWLDVHANADGTLKTTAVQTALGGSRSVTARLRQKLAQGLADAAIVIYTDSTGVFQSSGDPRWPYLIAQNFAAEYSALTVNIRNWNDTNSNFDAATTIQTGSGAQTLTIWNVAVSGKRPSYHLAPNLYAMTVTSPEPDLVIFSHGHNEGAVTTNLNTIQAQGLRLSILTEEVRKLAPFASSLIIGQNPETANVYQQQRAREYSWVAQMIGAGFIDVCQAFLDYGNWQTDLTNLDGVHPSVAGSALWAATVWEAFKPGLPEAAEPRQIPPSTLTTRGDVIASYQFADFVAGAVPPGWTDLNGNITYAQQPSFYESRKGFSVRLTSNTAAISRIYRDEMGAEAAKLVGGQWVTFMARFKRGSTQATTACQVAINDGVGFVQSAGNPQCHDGFYWEAVTMRIDPAATELRVSIYCDAAANNATDILFDRAILIRGRLPRDVQGSVNFDGEITAADIKVTGTTGAPHTGRFVGVTTAGAPSSGTYQVGDYAIDQNGQMYVCVAAGTPGTWVVPRDTTNLLTTGEETFPREGIGQNAATASGRLLLSFFTARKSETITQVRTLTGTTPAGATPTKCRIGLYTVDGAGAGTLVANVANDTTLWAAATTAYTKSFAASYAKVAGQRYALGVIVVTAAAMPTFAGEILEGNPGTRAEAGMAPRLSGQFAGQSDLPNSFAESDMAATPTASRPYAVLLP